MNCNQCQEAQNNTACTVVGSCGKDELLDLALKGLRNHSIKLAKEFDGVLNNNLDNYLIDTLFMQITNVNFNFDDVINHLKAAKEFTSNEVDYLKEAKEIEDFYTDNEDIRSIRETIYYGLMGMCAYFHHALNLNKDSKEIKAFLRTALIKLSDNSLGLEDYVDLMLETGSKCVEVMSLLDSIHTNTFGNPEISQVNIGVRNNPAILISGHDLNDIKQLLEQTEGTGVDVYTHSEMLAAHYYPELKKYRHLVGNYGNAWFDQVTTFETFNGPIVFTTNCLVPPKKDATYNDRVYTTGVTGMKGWKKISIKEDGSKDFSSVINQAKTLSSPTEIETGTIVGGFAHNQVLSLADQIIEKINEGKIKKFVVMAGCDGRQAKRKYYEDFANNLPKDTIILTAGCAKYRYNKLNLGDIDGIPRVLDAGQCNDSYSLAAIALKLSEVLNCDVNDLPIVYNIAWYEQKAVTVFLALLSLGVKNIKVGPTLPAFLSPNITQFLVDNFNVSTISDVETDMKELMA